MNQEAINQILEAKTETKTEVAQPATPQTALPVKEDSDPRISGKLDVLIRREATAVAREQAARTLEARIKEMDQSLKEREQRLLDFDQVKTNPKKALEYLGLDYNQLTQSLLNEGAIPPEVEIKKVRDELSEFKASQEQQRQRQAEEAKLQAEQNEQKIISDFKSEIGQYVSDNQARYELITFEGAQSDVFELIDEHYKRTIDPETGAGKVMSFKEACDKIEEYLEKREFERKKLSKINALWGNVPRQAQEKVIATARTQQEARKTPETKPRTLTNQLSATPQRPRSAPLTDDERIQKAIAYAKGLRPAL